MTGVLYWRVNRQGGNGSGNRGIKAGSVAGYTDRSTGYRKIGIDRRLYLASHVIWFLKTGRWPRRQIDHCNLHPGDNWWSNLRQATKAQNMRNRLEQRNNTSGMRGVYYDKRAGRYQVYIFSRSERVHLGSFRNLTEAKACRLRAERKYFGEFRPQQQAA